jgi:hypothetical protein
MNAYSEDLRKKIIEALGRGTTKSSADVMPPAGELPRTPYTRSSKNPVARKLPLCLA